MNWSSIFQRARFVAVNLRSIFNVRSYVLTYLSFRGVAYDFRADNALSLQDTKNDSFVFAAAAPFVHDFYLFAGVHVEGFTADVRFVNFDFGAVRPPSLRRSIRLHDVPDTLQNEPGGFLCDLYVPRDLVGGNAVLAIADQPHCRQPFIQADRRLFKNCAGIQAELPPCVLVPALPAVLSYQDSDALFVSARRAFDTVRPAPRDKIFPAVVGAHKVDYCLLKRCRYQVQHAYVDALLPIESALLRAGSGRTTSIRGWQSEAER